MKFTIELSDFYLDEENDLESALKDHIIKSCVKKISADLKSKIDECIINEIKKQVEGSLCTKISSFVSECIDNDKIKGRYTGDPEMTLKEWVKLQYTSTAKEKAPIDSTIEKLAKQFGEELKKRYDLLFASQLVAKMKDSGFIKEEVIQLLLNQQL